MTAITGRMGETNGAALVEQPAPGHLEVSQMPEAEYKRCTKCGETKAVEEFNRHHDRKDGLQTRCRPCQALATRESRRRHSDHANAVSRARRKREGEKRKLQQRKQRHRDRKDKTPARRATLLAIRKGVLVRPDACGKCGATERAIHAHHTDYSKPLEVEWLCPPCHADAHYGPIPSRSSS